MEISNLSWSGSAFSGRIELYSITCNFISHQAMLHCIELCIVENSLNNHIFGSGLKQPKSLQLKWKDYKTYVNTESTSPFFPLYFQVAPQSQFSWEKDFLFEKFCQSGGGPSGFWKLQSSLLASQISNLKSPLYGTISYTLAHQSQFTRLFQGGDSR